MSRAAEPEHQGDQRRGGHDARPHDRAVEPGFEQGPLCAALAWIACVGLVVEHVVHAVHQQVVRNQEEDRADDEQRVYAAGREQVRGGERKRGVDPAHRS
jgi:hypothetical protein